MEADLYDQLWQIEQNHWWFRARRQIVCSLIRRYSGRDAGARLRICDLGCGTGGNLAELADAHDVVGIEFSPQAIAYAQKRLGDRVRRGSLPDDVDLPDASCDVVLLTDVLEHVDEDARSAQTALRLLRPGGIVVATVPAYQWLYSEHDARHRHFRRYGKRQFRDLWSTADVRLLSHYNMLLFPPAAAVRLANRWWPSSVKSHGLELPPAPLNGLLARVMQSESPLLGRIPLPVGLSLVAVVRKRGVDGATSAVA
jgi:SAM-dependent methyltransferase